MRMGYLRNDDGGSVMWCGVTRKERKTEWYGKKERKQESKKARNKERKEGVERKADN